MINIFRQSSEVESNHLEWLAELPDSNVSGKCKQSTVQHHFPIIPGAS